MTKKLASAYLDLVQLSIFTKVLLIFNCSIIFKVGSVIEWFKRRDRDQNPLAPFCCVLGKDTLRHIPLLGGLGK